MKAKATISYPPDYDGELHIDLERTEVTKTFDYVEVKLKIAVRKDEDLYAVVRRLGTELATKPLRIHSEVKPM